MGFDFDSSKACNELIPINVVNFDSSKASNALNAFKEFRFFK